MIDATTSVQGSNLLDTVRKIAQTQKNMESFSATATSGADAAQKGAPSFGDMLSQLVSQVNSTQKAAAAGAQAVMTGKSTNIHQAMLGMQEAGTAFTLMSEVRNKLVSAYQELMRMQV
jgi:flagellar hook-basal body complex protein FliE